MSEEEKIESSQEDYSQQSTEENKTVAEPLAILSMNK